jgi:predicted anti-sigma-YlaC factor YlaD
MGAVLPAECERARTRASLGLDGELSQVEQALLRAHVGRCASCAGFALDLGGLTQEIRATPLEPPLRTWVPARRRRAAARSLQVCAAAVALVVAAGLGGLAGSLTSGKQAQGVRSAHLTKRALPSDAVSRFVAQLQVSHSPTREPV